MAKGRYNDLIQYSSVGLEFIITFGLLLAAGWWLDKRFGTSPVCMLVGGALGFVAAMVRLVRKGREIAQAGQKDDQQDKDG